MSGLVGRPADAADDDVPGEQDAEQGEAVVTADDGGKRDQGERGEQSYDRGMGPTYYTTTEAADIALCHVVTVRLALEGGALHGYQRKRGGRWLILDDCLTAWTGGARCAHGVPAHG